MIATAGTLVNIVANLVPLGLGVAEGGTAALDGGARPAGQPRRDDGCRPARRPAAARGVRLDALGLGRGLAVATRRATGP
ncbi:MAG: hypothetical protein IPH44_41195 [Myxococcales bacterium]|nr:hypothetical protein [Myxococcales bacterium]